MTLKFPSLKKLMDYIRASHVANCELNTTKCTLTSEFLGADIDLANSYGAMVMEEGPIERLNNDNRFSNHT